MMIRNIFCLFMSLFIVMSSFTTAHAETPPPGGWKWDNAKVTVTREHNAFKASLQAQKTYQVAVVDPKTREILMKTKQQASTIKVAPTATSVGKTLMKRVPAVAMTQAIIALLGKSVDWVMDPENNGVKYKEPKIPDVSDPSLKYLWQSYDTRKLYANPSDACKDFTRDYGRADGRFRGDPDSEAVLHCYMTGADTTNHWITKQLNPAYDSNAPVPEPEWKRIPISSVAQKVLDQANAGEAPATEVISDAALDMFESGALDGALDAAADPKVFGENEYHPNDPALKDFGSGSDGQPGQDGSDGQPGQDGQPAELPAFCSWASIVCDWIGWTKEAHKETQDAIAANTEEQAKTNEKLDKVTVTREDGQEAIAVEPPAFCDWASYVCDFIDWVQAEPEPEPEPDYSAVDIQDPEFDAGILEKMYISTPAACPPDPVLEFMGGRIPFPMSVFCGFAEMMKPLILLFAYIKGLSVIGSSFN